MERIFIKWVATLTLYKKILIIFNKMSTGPRKRKVALWKSKGDTKGAIRELCHYLTYFMVDHEAWYELAQLYLKTMNYSKAAYCYEELILINTFNHLYHQRYAEIRWLSLLCFIIYVFYGSNKTTFYSDLYLLNK